MLTSGLNGHGAMLTCGLNGHGAMLTCGLNGHGTEGLQGGAGESRLQGPERGTIHANHKKSGLEYTATIDQLKHDEHLIENEVCNIGKVKACTNTVPCGAFRRMWRDEKLCIFSNLP